MEGTTNLIAQRLFAFSLKGAKALKRNFEQAAIPHLSHMYTAALYLTKNENEAEDLVQETYLRAFRFFHKFEPGTNCRAWLLSIQRNIFINRYRQKNREPEIVNWEEIDQAYESMIDQSEELEKNNPEELVLSRLMDQEIKRALQDLPEEFRTAIILVDIEELSYEEAAQVMQCAVGTIRSRLSRGRRMLQVGLRNFARARGLIKE